MLKKYNEIISIAIYFVFSVGRCTVSEMRKNLKVNCQEFVSKEIDLNKQARRIHNILYTYYIQLHQYLTCINVKVYNSYEAYLILKKYKTFSVLIYDTII